MSRSVYRGVQHQPDQTAPQTVTAEAPADTSGSPHAGTHVPTASAAAEATGTDQPQPSSPAPIQGRVTACERCSQTAAAAALQCHASSPTQQTPADETSDAEDAHERHDAHHGTPTAPGSRAAAAHQASSLQTDAEAPCWQLLTPKTSAHDADPAPPTQPAPCPPAEALSTRLQPWPSQTRAMSTAQPAQTDDAPAAPHSPSVTALLHMRPTMTEPAAAPAVTTTP